MTHRQWNDKAGGEIPRCCVGHGDGQGPCYYCAGCDEHIRPNDYESECPGRKTPEQKWLDSGILIDG